MQPEQPTDAMIAAARAYAESTWTYDPADYISAEHRDNHINADARGTAHQPWFVALWQAGIAEGLRQATEGWDREWLVNHPPYGGADTFVTEGSAREEAARVGRPVFVRLVGPWEPAAEQPEPDRSAPVRVHVRHDPAALMEEPDLYAAEKPEGSDR